MELPRPIESMDKATTDRLLERSAVSIADQYGHIINQVRDNAKMNDIMLRAAIQLPVEIQSDTRLFKDFLHRLSSRTNAILGKRGVQPGDRVVFAERMEGLSSSVYQLSNFVRNGRTKNPDFRFATSVWLDVLYGYDLLRAWPVWVPERQSLDIFVTGYQAKASRRWLEPEEVRELPVRYRGQKQRAQRDLEFDPGWVIERIMSETDLLTKRDVVLALQGDKERARRMLETMTTDAGTPYQRWYAAYVRAGLAGQVATELGIVTAQEPQIRQRGQEVALRFIVDTKRGLEDLTQEQALQYGRAA